MGVGRFGDVIRHREKALLGSFGGSGFASAVWGRHPTSTSDIEVGWTGLPSCSGYWSNFRLRLRWWALAGGTASAAQEGLSLAGPLTAIGWPGATHQPQQVSPLPETGFGSRGAAHSIWGLLDLRWRSIAGLALALFALAERKGAAGSASLTV